jgi:uncharacterized membrane protein YcaP (DUF421 family)
MNLNDLAQTALRATAVYFFVLVVVRLLGKREVGNITAFDFLVALMIGEMVDEAILGSATLTKEFVAIGTVAAWHFLNSWASYKSGLVDRITGAEPTVLVENGQIKRDALAHERMNEDELWTELRQQSIEDLGEVKRATLEPTGQVSVLKQDWAKPLQKADVQRDGQSA